MANKDADLASDYAGESLVLTAIDTAQYAVDLVMPVDQPFMEDLYLTDVGGPFGSGGPTYVMRGYDGTLTSLVYWESSIVDSGGVSYGGPGPLSDIVVSAVKGA